MDLGQRAASVKFLIRDRAGQFTGSFHAVFTAEGIRILASPPQAPRAKAICERIIGTLRREVLDRLLIVNEHHLRQVLTEYLRHYNTARPHRALRQPTPAQADTQPPEPINLAEHPIRRKQVLGGLTHEYRVAALPPTLRNRRSPSRIVFPSPTGCAAVRRWVMCSRLRAVGEPGDPSRSGGVNAMGRITAVLVTGALTHRSSFAVAHSGVASSCGARPASGALTGTGSPACR